MPSIGGAAGSMASPAKLFIKSFKLWGLVAVVVEVEVDVVAVRSGCCCFSPAAELPAAADEGFF